jgi:hypothetical protein
MGKLQLSLEGFPTHLSIGLNKSQSMDNNKLLNRKKACACCGFFTIGEKKQTCPVCFWEEDFFQEENEDDNGGPNSICLREARNNFILIGAIHKDYISLVRAPFQDEF